MTPTEFISQEKIANELKRISEIPILAKPATPIDLLQLEITGEGGVHAIKRDRLTHAITAQIVESLEANGWYRRDGVLMQSDLTGSRLDVPHDIQVEAVQSIKYCVKEEVEWTDAAGKKRSRIAWNPPTELPKKIESLLDQADMRQVTQKVLGSANISNLTFANEPLLDGKTFSPPTEPPEPITDLERSHKSRAEHAWLGWLMYMQKCAPTQLKFFDLLGHAHCYAARSSAYYSKHIHVGVGPNGSGKGTMIRILDCIPGFAKVKIFSMDDASAEYRADQIFDGRTPLIGCHEWRFEKNAKIDAFIGAMKSATRGEVVNVRGVGKAAQAVRPKCSFFLFYNSPSAENEEVALEDCHRRMSEWDAYDRVNVAYIDWVATAKRIQPEMFGELMWAIQFAPSYFGVCVRRYFEGLDKVQIDAGVSYIPVSYRDERSQAADEPWHGPLIRAADMAARSILYYADGSLTLEEIDELGRESTLAICEALGIPPPPKHHWFLERKDAHGNYDFSFILPASTMSAALRSKGARQYWTNKIPKDLKGVMDFNTNKKTLEVAGTRIHKLITDKKAAALFLQRIAND